MGNDANWVRTTPRESGKSNGEVIKNFDMLMAFSDPAFTRGQLFYLNLYDGHSIGSIDYKAPHANRSTPAKRKKFAPRRRTDTYRDPNAGTVTTIKYKPLFKGHRV